MARSTMPGCDSPDDSMFTFCYSLKWLASAETAASSSNARG
jgi:hypothetical protein